MLDIRALNAQLTDMASDLGRQADVTSGRLAAALALLDGAARTPATLLSRLEAYAALPDAPWLVGQPLEPLDAVRPLPAWHGPSSVVATDGSQITPSHHEIALCYLINVGRILYTYGTGEPPIQDSRPFLFHRERDMRPLIGKRHVTITEELVATFRDVHERAALVDLAREATDRGHPVLALVDGSLIQWMLEEAPEAFQQEVLSGHLAVLEALRGLGVAVAGYVSGSRSADVSNLLKLAACPKPQLECGVCAWQDPPCETGHAPVGDRRIWEARLSPGERSPLFQSSARILAKYGAHHVVFFYLHVGSEVARIEMPAWVAEDAALLDRVHALAHDQAQKGRGYPVALAEAHHQAVITREDRAQFFSLLGHRLAGAGVRVAVSSKQLKKRRGVV